jgi:hypothetical protein
VRSWIGCLMPVQPVKNPTMLLNFMGMVGSASKRYSNINIDCKPALKRAFYIRFALMSCV